MTTADLPNVLTVSEYAGIVRLSADAVAWQCRKGRIKGAVQVGRVWRIPKTAVPVGLMPAPVGETAQERKSRAKASVQRLHEVRRLVRGT